MTLITKELILSVTYNPNGTPPEVLNAQLHAVAANAAGDGMLSGTTAAEVETWDATVRDVLTDVRSGGEIDVKVCDVSTSVNPDILTQAEIETLRGLRARGFAVALFNEVEMRGADQEDIEGAMITAGNLSIEMNATEPAPDDESDTESD